MTKAMCRLYLVRHGENQANLSKEFSYRRVDYPLTPKGVLQAQQTAEYFADKDIHAIYSSPLKRAVETAEIIGARLRLGVTILENLREINVGDLEGQPPTAESWALFGEVVKDWLSGHPERAFPGGEDYHTLCQRMRAALEEISAGRDGDNIVVVGHGGIFTLSLPDLCPGIDLGWVSSARSANCSVSEFLLERREGRIVGQLVTWASHAHLHGAAAELIPGAP